ncbi:MAG: S24 family peptidase [Aquisalimonadaceae bacterium]
MPNQNNEQSETLGQRLRSLRGRRPRDIFAMELGVHKNTLARYETDERRPDAAFIRKVCHHCGVASDWLLNGGNDARDGDDGGRYHAPEPLPPLSASPLLLQRGWIESERLETDNLMVATMAGDSMRPTLNDGDVLIVQCGEGGLRRDGVHLLELDGAYAVKRIHGLGGQAVQLLSDNTGYPALYLSATDLGEGGRCRVVGRVIWQLRKI